MDIIPIQCPHCLGELEVNWGVGTAVCLYCRGKMVIKLPFDHAQIAQSSSLTDKQLALTQLAALLKKISLPSAALRENAPSADVFVGREQPKPTSRNQANPIQRAPIHQRNQRQNRLTAFFQKQNFLFYFSGERQVRHGNGKDKSLLVLKCLKRRPLLRC